MNDSTQFPFYQYNLGCFILKRTEIFPQFSELHSYNQCLRKSFNDIKSVISMFCDGSKNEEGVGCGFVISKREVYLQYRILVICSIYTAETFAIANELSWCSEKRNSNCNYFVAF